MLGENMKSRDRSEKVVRKRDKALRKAIEQLFRDRKVVRFTELQGFLIKEGLSFQYSEKLIMGLVHYGALRRVDRGLYEVDIERLKVFIES
jgi:cobalamin biosynthesis protein CbiD